MIGKYTFLDKVKKGFNGGNKYNGVIIWRIGKDENEFFYG